MSDSFIQVAPDSTGKKMQTFVNTKGGSDVHAEAVLLVDANGDPLVTIPVSGGLTDAELRASPIDIKVRDVNGNGIGSISSALLVRTAHAVDLTAQQIEDVASPDGAIGIPAMAVRHDAPSATSDTDGDYEFIQVADGQLWVRIKDGSDATQGITTGAAVITDANGTLQQYLRGLVKLWATGTLGVVPNQRGAANPSVLRATASTSAATLAIARATRRGILIRNLDPSITIYVGPATVTTSNGFPILPGEGIPFSWVGLIQVIAPSGSPAYAAWDEYD